MVEFWEAVRTGLEAARAGEMHQLDSWSYVLIAVLVATEGPVTTLVGAAGAAAGLLDIRFVFIATMLGNIAGDALWYSVGYAGNVDRMQRVSRYAGIREEHLGALRTEMQSHATKAILLSKISFGLIIPTLVAAGVARVSWRKWFPAVFVAETLWSILLVTLGYHAAGAISQLERGLRFGGVVLALTVATFVIVFAVHKLKAQAASVPVSMPNGTVAPNSPATLANDISGE